jgi:chromosome partitioning protein
MTKIVFTNQKGGVGKTTLTRELGCYLSHEKGFRVLLVDCDGQGNLSKGFLDEPGKGLYEAVAENEINFQSISDNLDILSGSIYLSLLEKQLVGEIDSYVRFKELFEREEFEAYDFILMDTPPSLGILTGNALAAADYLVMPVTASQYALQGTGDLLETLEKIRRSLNPSLLTLGVILNSYSPVTVIGKELKAEVKSFFGETCFETVISRSIRIEEAIAERKGLVQLLGNQWKRPQEEVSRLGEELLSRIVP